MEDSGLGTPATRAGIIELLIARHYVERNGRSLIPTPKGLEVYDIVKREDDRQREHDRRVGMRLA
mgnify:CR=1 FL=1